MTIILELTPEQETKLQGQARASGVEPADYLRRLLDEAPAPPKGLLPGETLLDAMTRIGVVGVAKARPRPDGKAWSECEGFE